MDTVQWQCSVQASVQASVQHWVVATGVPVTPVSVNERSVQQSDLAGSAPHSVARGSFQFSSENVRQDHCLSFLPHHSVTSASELS